MATPKEPRWVKWLRLLEFIGVGILIFLAAFVAKLSFSSSFSGVN